MPGDLMSLERDEDKDDKDSRRNRTLLAAQIHLNMLALLCWWKRLCYDENNSKRLPRTWARAIYVIFCL
jgi:hypothetical protein